MSEDQKDKYPPKGESRETFEGTRFDDADLQKVHTQLMREKEEPSENFSPMPLFFVALFMILAFWATPTMTLGHLFTQGTADSNEIWVDVVVRAENGSITVRPIR